MVRLKLECVIVKKFLNLTSVLGHMGEYGGEVVVHRDYITWLDECAADYVFGCTALVDRKQIFLAKYFFDSFLKALE
jgi:hypothetical protein